MSTHRIIPGDCILSLQTLPDASVHCCVTSPPYFGLCDYGHDRQIGLESTPEAYVARMVEVFRDVRRVLRKDGTLWLNLGDSYGSTGGDTFIREEAGRPSKKPDKTKSNAIARSARSAGNRVVTTGLKRKDLIGIPWRVAFALQADGWWLRQDIIWHKPKPMPESVTDRCTKAHEYIFLLTKSAQYWYDHNAIREPIKQGCDGSIRARARTTSGPFDEKNARNMKERIYDEIKGANKRSVWTVLTKPYSGAHFATFPPKLIEPCILAGCPEGGTVLDPFAGSGTTLAVAAELGRNGIGCELNPEYIALAEQRIKDARASVALFEGITL